MNVSAAVVADSVYLVSRSVSDVLLLLYKMTPNLGPLRAALFLVLFAYSEYFLLMLFTVIKHPYGLGCLSFINKLITVPNIVWTFYLSELSIGINVRFAAMMADVGDGLL